jgi:HEAT repeat protein
VPVLLDMLNREKVALAVDAKEEYRDQFISKAMQSAAMALAAIKEKSALGPLKKAAESDGDSDVRSACRNAVKAIEP